MDERFLNILDKFARSDRESVLIYVTNLQIRGIPDNAQTLTGLS